MNNLYFFICTVGIFHLGLAQQIRRRQTDIENSGNTSSCKDLGINTKFFVGLQKPLRRHHCGATLLNSHWVLSTAQCRTKGLYAVAGINDVQDYYVMSKIDRIFPHPHWNKTTNADDIALFELVDTIKANNPFVEYVKLPEKQYPTYQMDYEVCKSAYILGIPYRKDGTFRDQIRCQLDLQVMSWQFCSSEYMGAVAVNILCTGSGAEVCRGDLGGPLMCGNIQYGVISSQECDDEMTPIYTRIDPLLPFIRAGMRRREKIARSASQKMYSSGALVVVSLFYYSMMT
ncbi:unnamed protein product [Phaedon cochleariae]|uniref:Peptidase S1 domain-containing protein n=1 Tax=Phaedon cochleariae TaxID=80249 RepID=A0A9P0DXQ8_PHACE|nr:unnamed protein product [Phaedon cochleariae]